VAGRILLALFLGLAQAVSSPRVDIVEQPRRLCCDAIAIDGTGRLLATAFNNDVTMWDLETGLEVRTLVPRARAIAGMPAAEAVDSVAVGGYSGLAFDPSGRYVALTAVDNVNPRTFVRGRLLAFPQVWEVETGRDVSAVEWSYDAALQRTVSAEFPFDPREVLFWQLTTDPAVASKLARYGGSATTFSPDGRLGIAFAPEGAGPDYAYRLTAFDLDASRELWTRRTVGGSPPMATFSPDGRLLVVASWNVAHVIDARTGAQIAEVPGGRVAFSGDVRRLVVAREGEAHVFAAPDWRPVAQMRVPDAHRIQGVVFTPDARVIGVTDQAIHVWDAAGQALRRFSMDGAWPVQSMTVSPGGRWLAVGTPRIRPGLSPETDRFAAVFAWPLSGVDGPRPLWAEGDLSILDVAFSADETRVGRVAFAERPRGGRPWFDGGITIQHLATAEQQNLDNEDGDVRQGRYDVVPRAAAQHLAFTSDGATIVAGMLGLRARAADRDSRFEREFTRFPQLVFLDARTLQPRRVVEMGGSEFTALAVNGDGSLVATGHDANTVRVWAAATARQRTYFLWPEIDRRDVLGGRIFDGWVTGLAFHPDGRRLAVARHDGVALVDVVAGSRQNIAEGRQRSYSAVSVSPDGTSLVFASSIESGEAFVDTRISQWITATGRPGWELVLGDTSVTRLAFAPTGTWFAVATSGGVEIHGAATGAHLATFALLGTADWLVWTPDGRYAGSPAGIARLGAVRRGNRAVPLATVGRQLELRDLLAQVLP